MRQRTTRAERRLWRALEALPLEGTHLRRQVAIGPYVVDFACLAARLVIELDGPSHTERGAAERDAARQAWLEAEGFRVLRFWNGEVDRNLAGVLDTIYATLHGGLAADPERFRHRRRPKPSPGAGLGRTGGSTAQPAGWGAQTVVADATAPRSAPSHHPTPDLRSDPPPPGEGKGRRAGDPG